MKMRRGVSSSMLIPVTSGDVIFNGEDISALTGFGEQREVLDADRGLAGQRPRTFGHNFDA